jgi:hypothetical protein
MIKLLNKTCHNCGADTSHDTSVKVAYKCPNKLCNVYQRGNECETYGVNPSVEQEKKYGGFVVHQTAWKQSFCKVHGSGGEYEFYCETHEDIGCTGMLCHIDVEVYPSLDCNMCDSEDIDALDVCMDCEHSQKTSEGLRIDNKIAWEKYVKENQS